MFSSRRGREPEFSERNLEEFLEERIGELARKDPIFEYLDDRCRSRETASNLVSFVFDGMEALIEARKEPRDLWEGAIELAAMYSSALIVEDRNVDIDDRGLIREIEDLARGANELKRAIERSSRDDPRDRRSFRDDRRGGGFGRNTFSGRDQGRFSRDDRGERRGYYEERERQRASYRDDRREEPRGRYERGSVDNRRYERPSPSQRPVHPNARNTASSSIYARGVEARMRANGEVVERSRSDINDAFEEGMNQEFNMPNPSRVNRVPAYEQVQPNEVTARPSWKKETPKAKAPKLSKNGNPLATGPVTAEDIESGRIDLTDFEVVMSIPQDPAQVRENGELTWEADSVKPRWAVNAEGYRVLRFEPLNKDEVNTVDRKIHELPIVGAKEADHRFHPQNNEVRNALAGPRWATTANRQLRDAEREEYEKIVASMKEENESLSVEEQKPLPDAPSAGNVPHDQIMKNNEVIKGFSLSHIRMQELSRTEALTNDMTGHLHSNFNSFQTTAESYEPIMLCATVEEANYILKHLTMTGLNFQENNEVAYLLDIYDNLKRVAEKVPTQLVVAAKRHIFELVNSIFKLEMGTRLRIEDFEDISTLHDDVLKKCGKEFMEKLAKAFAYHMSNFQMFKVGSGITGAGVSETTDARTIYVVKRVNMVISPMLVNDLKLSIEKVDSKGKKKEVFFISQAATPRLHTAIMAMNFNADDDKVRYNYIWLADNSWVEVRKDFQDPDSNNFVIVLRTGQ